MLHDDECNTCGDTGRWETTTEDSPTTLVDLGPCPDCELGTAMTKVEAIASLLENGHRGSVNPLVDEGDDT